MYSLEYTEYALRQLEALDRPIRLRVVKRLDRLAVQAEDQKHQALSGPFAGQFKLRVGDYRVIYSLDATRAVITVLRVGHRSEIYRV